LHFTDIDKEIYKNDENYDRLWKTREISDMLNVADWKFYNPSEHLTLDEVNVLFKGKVAFKQYIPKKNKRFRNKISKFCDMTGNTYDMEEYLGKDRKHAIPDLTATHATVKQLT
jgi:hypothetical protein